MLCSSCAWTPGAEAITSGTPEQQAGNPPHQETLATLALLLLDANYAQL